MQDEDDEMDEDNQAEDGAKEGSLRVYVSSFERICSQDSGMAGDNADL